MPMSGRATRALFSEHGFLVYKIAILAAGGTPVVAPEKDLTADVDAMLARGHAAHEDRLPRQSRTTRPAPTCPFDEVKRLHAGLPPHVLLVLDAAYAEYVRRNDYASGLELVSTCDNVVMTRTFSKIYGLALLRLGWCYAPGPRGRRAEPHPRAVQRQSARPSRPASRRIADEAHIGRRHRPQRALAALADAARSRRLGLR